MTIPIFDGNGPTKAFNFADDKKIAYIVKEPSDCIQLQKAIDNLFIWANKNSLKFNKSKCAIMTFTHKRNPIVVDYYIDDEKIKRVDVVRDLGVIMDSKLSYSSHFEHIKQKSSLMLSFVKRTCRKKFNLDTAKLLYSSLVRSNLEFANIIWSPHTLQNINHIESVQKQAVIFLHQDYLNRSENDYVLSPYTVRCDELDLVPLVRRRINASILFLHKIISGRYNAPNIRNMLELNTGQRSLRNPQFIRIKYYHTEYGLFSSFNMACRAFNIATLFIDPTEDFLTFRRKLLSVPDDVFKNFYNIQN